MNESKTNALSSTLKGLIPAESGSLQGVRQTGVILKQPQLVGLDGLRQFIKEQLNVSSFKYDKKTDRLYVYVTGNISLGGKDYDKYKVIQSRVTTRPGQYSNSAFIVEKVSKFAVATGESYDEFIARIKSVVTAIQTNPEITTSFKSDSAAQRLYVYLKSSRQHLPKYQKLESALAYHGKFKQVSIGQYGLTLRFDYESNSNADVAVAPAIDGNKLLAGLQTTTLLNSSDGLFNHIEQLRGKVSDDVLERMKETLRASLPKPQWYYGSGKVEIINKLGNPIDLGAFYDLLTKPGSEQTPQHIGSGLKVRLAPNSSQLVGVAITLFLDRAARDSLYAVIRDEKGYHNHVKLVRK